jgi:hypothetical protein
MTFGQYDVIVAKINPITDQVVYIKHIGNAANGDKAYKIIANSNFLHILENEDVST